MTDKQIICKCNDKECGQCSFEEQLKAKEQECEELKKIINEAKNSKLDLKSFLVGEAVQNEYEQQLDQLKLENKHLNDLLNQALKELEKTRETLTEIKEIAEINPINTCWTVLELCEKCDENKECDIQCPLFKFKLILQKISECEVE
jgi:uncharacterized protein YukE